MGISRASTQVHPGYIAGKWYPSPVNGSVAVGGALSNGTVRLFPVMFTKPVKISDLGVRITTGSAGGNVRCAFYASDPSTNKPTGTAVVETGNISTTSTGDVSAAVAAQATLAPGLYFMAVNSDNAVVVCQIISNAETAGGLIGSATFATISWANTGANMIYTFASAFGAFPDLTGQTLTETGTNAWAFVWLKAA
jgi:hypothetical protein